MIGLLLILGGCLIGVYLSPLVGLVVAIIGVAVLLGLTPRA